LCLPEQSQIHALANVPPDQEVRTIAIDWAESVTSSEEEYLVAFRDGDGYFSVIRRASGELREALFPEKKRS